MTRAEKIEEAARALVAHGYAWEITVNEDVISAWGALRAALSAPKEAPAPSPAPREGECCGASDHPVFVYPCTLPEGHPGPHDNGSGDPWESP